uniref:Thyroglobulin type-1 domain-containing protein n=1 Tax=Cyprinus carpio TaxID=7962 RepID=A0A8C1W9G9_CYPCA
TFILTVVLLLITNSFLSQVRPERPKTYCEQHRDSLQSGNGGVRPIGAFIPQCDEEGQYRPQQCHGSTGHCWCVDSRGQERAGTRTPPGAPTINCDEPGKKQASLNRSSVLFLYNISFLLMN